MLRRWRQEGRALFVSTISLAELLSLPTLTPNETDTIVRFLRDFISDPFNERLARTAAQFRRDYNLQLPDAAIAATAFHHWAMLASRDRAFRKVKEITLVVI